MSAVRFLQAVVVLKGRLAGGIEVVRKVLTSHGLFTRPENIMGYDYTVLVA